MLDFDDLIVKAHDLLTDPRVAQWVLFRLDGGIDHILVDEAQDTNPLQWQVIRSLAQEFTAGIGAHSDRKRTIFVVGDTKQSIYSFQGADPEGFDRMRTHFREALTTIGAGFQSRDLLFSFRSSRAILAAVDQTFQSEGPAPLGPDSPRHDAFHEALPGRVDLWPALPKAPADERRVWTEPVDSVSGTHERIELARAIATQIRKMITTETLPVVQRDGTIRRRRITPGDFLILVRSRGEDARVSLFHEIIAACKAEGIEVAGADRVRLGAELAVKDIVALLRFLALPEDDLSLAAALRSPLLGLTEQELYALAQPRGDSHLWEALRGARDRHPAALAILEDLRDRAEFDRPYDLMNRLLTRHDGRRRLLARLGQEAEEGIDALLAQALAYERSKIPGLTGFVEWLGSDDVEIKRQIGARSDKVRVMTVHGAKGLEAPIVILPDTAKRTNPLRARLLTDDGQVFWPPAVEDMPARLRQLRQELKDAEARESLRLLYVAMTRAENWLIVCGAGDVGTGGESWHATIEEGLSHLGTTTEDFPTGPGPRFSAEDWSAAPLLENAEVATETVSIPAQLGPIAAAPEAPATLSPSDLGGAKTLPGEAEFSDEQALARGTLVHLLLEHLPAVEPGQRRARGQALIAAAPEAAGLQDVAALVDDAMRVIEAPALATLFESEALTEVEVTGRLGAATLLGAIDRLILTGDRVLAIDYKSNRIVPSRPQDTPEGLLRQMGAYDAMLREIWPGRVVEVAILWTSTATLMPLPAPLVAAALERARAG